MNEGVEMKKIIALILIFSLLVLSGNLISTERRGTELLVQKKYGKWVRGELIAVKENSLLLLSISGADVSIYIKDVNAIKIMRKSKTILGVGLGLLIGISIGALGTIIGWEIWAWAPHDTKTKYRIMARVGVVSGLVGAVVGGNIAHNSRPETIQIEGKSQEEIEKIFKKLRSKARIPDY